MSSISLLLFLAAASCVQCIELIQSENIVVRPGQSFTISCKFSGFSISSYCPGWIRQPAGKPLEHIGIVCSSSSSVKDSLKSKISFSADVSSSTVYLKGQNFQPEDSAVYYCARYTAGDAFDYWGKGTMVTVSSGVQTPPSSIFAVSSCGSSSDATRTLGCVTSGFSPAETLTFSWTGDVTEQVNYPAMQSSGAYTAVSQVQVKKSDWDAKKSFTCQVQHPALSGAKTATMKRPDDSEPTIRLMEFGQSIICLIENFYPPSLSITWKVDDSEVKGLDWYRVQNAQGSFKTVSLLEGIQMTKDTKYTCEVTHEGKPHKKEATFKAKFSLKINPPSAKDIFVFNKAIITCVITGDNENEVKAANVSWTVGEQPASAGSTVTDKVKETTAPFTKNSTLTLSESDWFSGKEVKCSTEKDKTPFSETIKVKKGGERPSVLFYKPEKHVSDSDTEKVSLLCEVSSSDLGNVYIMWQKNNDPYMESSSTVRVNDNTVLSYLTVSGTEYNKKNNKFACAAKDANTDNDITPRKNSTSTSKLFPCPVCPADC